ncbi:exodeoxyribonuclease VII large subunit [Candidatus Desantisbacteria bacterium]|nr:exodeoxyribonuclease VII large subunit [Candidatus Desantisbacteria bacterium]
MQKDFSGGTGNEKKVFTITDVTRSIKELLETRFANIWIEGEISDFKKPGSGHFYFTLKDASSQIRAVMFRYNNQRLRFAPEDGLKVLVFGTIGVYEKRGEYQILIEIMEPLGLGALQLTFEKLKKKLEAEGLFDKERKRPIPLFPGKIGIVTSPTGAAIKDILNVINRRFCNVHIIIYPVRVQGIEAPEEIAKGIEELNKMDDIDVIIAGRGGGSFEDLWAFNEEIVARAIYSSRIPVISAVGHEIDFTIADFVADLRAPTPSAAAELVVQNKSNVENIIRMYNDRIISLCRNTLTIYKNNLQFLSEKRCLLKPLEVIHDMYQEVDEYLERIKILVLNRVKEGTLKFDTLNNAMIYLGPLNKILYLNDKVSDIERRLISNVEHYSDNLRGKLNILIAKIDSLSPLSILSRGYSMTFILPERKLLTSSANTSPGEELEIKLSHGGIICEVKKILNGEL